MEGNRICEKHKVKVATALGFSPLFLLFQIDLDGLVSLQFPSLLWSLKQGPS